MLQYIFRRLLIAIPTLLVISFAVFGLSKCAPGDPVEDVFGEDVSGMTDPVQIAENYRGKAARLGIDKPLFYFSLSTAVYPDSLWKIYPPERRNQLTQLAAQNGNWPATCAYEAAVQQTKHAIEQLPDSTPQKPYLYRAMDDFSHQTRFEILNGYFQQVESISKGITGKAPQLEVRLDTLKLRLTALTTQIKTAKHYIPALHWYGLNNQYHLWLTGFLTGNWGLTKKQLPVWQELKPALYASMSINALAIFFAYLISIPLGVEMARRKGSVFDRWAQKLLIFIHAMPVFWLGGLLVILFCSPVFGKPILGDPYLDISDAWNVNSQPFMDWFSEKLPQFALPIAVLTLYAITIIAVQMRGGMLETMGQDYIRTARAKGVQEEDVYWTHAFRNALFPVITIFASVFPALFTGSLVIETLFNFPGMGQKAQLAFQGHDLAILSAILTAAAVFTILGNLVADLLYAWADPRVRFVS